MQKFTKINIVIDIFAHQSIKRAKKNGSIQNLSKYFLKKNNKRVWHSL